MQEIAIGIKDAARAVGISPWTMRSFIRQGKIRAVRIGRRVLVEPAELKRLIEQGRIGEQRYEHIV
jgi:excisionase family DNA binding protein